MTTSLLANSGAYQNVAFKFGGKNLVINDNGKNITLAGVSIQDGPLIFKLHANLSQAKMPVERGTIDSLEIVVYDRQMSDNNGTDETGKLCSENFKNVQVERGLLNIQFGSAMKCVNGKSFQDNIIENSDMYLQLNLAVKGNPNPEAVKPRIQFGSVPFAVKANAATHANDALVCEMAAQSVYTHRAAADFNLYETEDQVGYFEFETPKLPGNVNREKGGWVQWHPINNVDKNNSEDKEMNVINISSDPRRKYTGTEDVDLNLEKLNLHSKETLAKGSFNVKDQIIVGKDVSVNAPENTCLAESKFYTPLTVENKVKIGSNLGDTEQTVDLYVQNSAKIGNTTLKGEVDGLKIDMGQTGTDGEIYTKINAAENAVKFTTNAKSYEFDAPIIVGGGVIETKKTGLITKINGQTAINMRYYNNKGLVTIQPKFQVVAYDVLIPGDAQVNKTLSVNNLKVTGSVDLPSTVNQSTGRYSSSLIIGENHIPGEELSIYKNAIEQVATQYQNSRTGTGTGNGFIVGIESGGNGIIWNRENNYMRFGTNANERMRITSSGNVGIGTTSPSQKLEVKGNIKATKVYADSVEAKTVKLGNQKSFNAYHALNNILAETSNVLGKDYNFCALTYTRINKAGGYCRVVYSMDPTAPSHQQSFHWRLKAYYASCEASCF